MDINGKIHFLSKDENARLAHVPIEYAEAALKQMDAGESLFYSSNRRAAAWARLTAAKMCKAAKDKRQRRRSARVGKVSRRKNRKS